MKKIPGSASARTLALLLMLIAGSAGAQELQPNSVVGYIFWSPTLTGTENGQPFQGQLTGEFTFVNGVPGENAFFIDGRRGGIGGLEAVSPTEWCNANNSSCITKVPGGLDVQISQNEDGGTFVYAFDITSTATSVSYNSGAGNYYSPGGPVSLSASGGPGVWEVGVPEPSPLALWGAALLVSCIVLLHRFRIGSKATALRPQTGT